MERRLPERPFRQVVGLVARLLAVVPALLAAATAVIGVVFTLYISFGVLALNYHYPSDVLGGWLLTAGWWYARLLWTNGWVDEEEAPPRARAECEVA